MTKISGTSHFIAILSAVTMGAVLLSGAGQARAQSLTEDQMLQALTPKPKAPLSRGLSMGNDDHEQVSPVDAAAQKFVDTVRDRPAASLTGAERDEIAIVAKDKPNIDLTINFAYKSAEISPKSLPDVQKLGRVLTNAKLQGSTFLLAGYTDAAGGDTYNQQLSERRADSVKRYLMEHYHLVPTDLVTVGYGKTRLKDPSHPLSEVNRRVQVVNMENKSTASK